MGSYVIDEVVFDSQVQETANVLEVAGMFGLGADSRRKIKVLEANEIDVECGQVVYITGASGSGKSLLLRQLREKLAGAVDIAEQELPGEKPLVDCFEGDLSDALKWLSLAGLSDAFALLRSEAELSDGQRYRFRLALAMAQRPRVICIDEFCATLDRVTAAVVAHNVRRFADEFGTVFVVVASQDDLLEDLCPDVVVIKHLGSGCDILYPRRMVEQD
ncbi:MAG: AAA family ATPase [Sedimentisphaerales bacterium]|nr:AAA family ATPase [Sedimentisphaerales bacterium]